MQHHQIQIDDYLKTLSLHRIRDIYAQEAENAANTKLSYHRVSPPSPGAAGTLQDRAVHQSPDSIGLLPEGETTRGV